MSSAQYAFASAPSPEELAGFALNDLGNAMRLIRLVGGTVDEEDGEVDTRDASLLYLRERGMVSHTPLGRLGKPEELAEAYCWLASDTASFITGTVLSVDGGVVVGT